MAAGTLAMACLCLTLGQVEPVYTNARGGLSVPFDLNQAELNNYKHMLLFSSTDQGKSWNNVEIMQSPQLGNNAFKFMPQGDGTYWLRVAAILRQTGQQEPANLSEGGPQQIVIVDTAKPYVHSLQAKRDGEQVHVSWQLQEEHPDWNSFRVEYLPQGKTAWTALQVPGEHGGLQSFQPNTSAPLTIRLSLRDKAGNATSQLAEVPGSVAVAAFSQGPAPAVANPPPAPVPSLQAQISVPSPGPGPMAPPLPVQREPAAPQPWAQGQSSMPLSPGHPGNVQMPVNPGPTAPGSALAAPPYAHVPSPTPAQPPPPEVKYIADSTWATPTGPTREATPPITPSAPAAAGPAVPSPTSVPAQKLPVLEYVKQRKLTFQSKVSNLGRVELQEFRLYCTRNDGVSWTVFAEDKQPREISNGLQEITVELDDDGIYGFRAVTKNRFGFGKPPPKDGEAPELRVELDTVAPIAKLIAPDRDPVQPDALVLRWEASDKNLDKAPINLEWAVKRDGPWQPIALALPNNPNRYTWQPPKDSSLPVEVYLRLRVRDAAGNEGIAATLTPVPIDLSEPEAHLTGVVPQRP
jgi:hypothetical protein